MNSDAAFAETQAARDAWERLGASNELLAPEHFQHTLAPREAYYDHTSHWEHAEPRKIGADSRALQDVINGCCQGWAEPPTAAELHAAFKAKEPTARELALLRTWVIEATIGQLFEAWAQRAYTDRELVKAVHLVGLGRTERPMMARRIRIMNSWAIR